MSYQDELNRINKTSNLTVRQCFQTLAGGDPSRSTRDLANAYCGTVNQPTQIALNVKIERNWTTLGLLTKQDAAKAIPTPE